MASLLEATAVVVGGDDSNSRDNDNNNDNDIDDASNENSFEADTNSQDPPRTTLSTLDPQNQQELRQLVDLLDDAENGEQLLALLARLPSNSFSSGYGRTMRRIIQAMKSGVFLSTDLKLRPDFSEKYGRLKMQERTVELPLAIKALRKDGNDPIMMNCWIYLMNRIKIGLPNIMASNSHPPLITGRDGVNNIALLAMAKVHPSTRDLFVDFHSEVEPNLRPQALDSGITNTKNDKLQIILDKIEEIKGTLVNPVNEEDCTDATCPDNYDGFTVIQNIDPSLGSFNSISELKKLEPAPVLLRKALFCIFLRFF